MVAHMDQPKESMDIENSSLSSMVSHTHLRMDEFDHVDDEQMTIGVEELCKLIDTEHPSFFSTSVSHQLPSFESESEPREHSLSKVANKNQTIESVEIENFSISSMVSQSHKRNLPEKIMKKNFKTFFLLEGNQLKMPFHNNDLCGMVQALQLEEHDHPTYIPVPLSSIHLGVRVVNFTAQVEVTQKFVNKEARPIECVYFFPVEEEAAVVNFTTELKGRSIKHK